VSLSSNRLLSLLKSSLICGFKNIKDEPYSGKSGHHDPDTAAVHTTNGAGPHNVQMFILNSDGIVLHCLPGYWAPDDFILEIHFALTLNRIWHDTSLTSEQKKEKYSAAQLAQVRKLPADLLGRSKLQNFDASHELKKESTDFTFKQGDYRPPGNPGSVRGLKSTAQVAHERMAKRPFVAYADFDTHKFSDYGKWRYDKKEEQKEAALKAGTLRKK
jgi:hypothetical protein